MTNYIFDIILLIIFLISIFIGIRKGAVKIFLSLVAFVAAAYFAYFFSAPAAAFVNNTFFEPKIIEAVETSVDGSVESLRSALPEFIVNNSDKLGLDLNTANVIDAEKFVNDSVSPIIEDVISSIIMFLLFIILSIVFNFLANIINKLVKISFLGKVNKLLGGVFGGLTGSVIVLVICLIIKNIFLISSKGIGIISEETLEASYIYNFLINIF